MIAKKYSSVLGLSVNVLVFESYSEADAAAGRANAMLDAGNDNGHYRGTAAEVREFLSDLIEKETGIPRNTKKTGKKDKDGVEIEVYNEADVAYINRAAAEKGWEDLKQFQPALDKWAAAALPDDQGRTGYAEDGTPLGRPLAIDLKERERKVAGPKKLAQKYVDTATQLLDGGKLDKLNERLSKSIGKKFVHTTNHNPEIDAAANKAANRATDVQALGWLVKEFSDWTEKQGLLKLVS